MKCRAQILFHRLLSLLLVAVVVACGQAPTYEPLPPGTTVLAFGDSVTYGTGAARGQDYPTRLAERSGWEIVNAGVPGDTAQEALRRIDTLLAQSSPTLVIVELGGNDFLRRREQAAVREDLRAIVRAVKQFGALPVLVAVPEVSLFGATIGSLSDASIYRELADEEGLLLIEDVFSDVLSDDSLRADQIHPNADGYRVFADGIAAALAEAGLLAGED